MDGQIASDFKTHSFTSVIRSGIDRISSYDRSKHRPKSERVGRNLLGLERDERLESCFHSIEGRRFYESFRAGDPRPSVYFETVLKQRTISLLEWCLVNSFSYD